MYKNDFPIIITNKLTEAQQGNCLKFCNYKEEQNAIYYIKFKFAFPKQQDLEFILFFFPN